MDTVLAFRCRSPDTAVSQESGVRFKRERISEGRNTCIRTSLVGGAGLLRRGEGPDRDGDHKVPRQRWQLLRYPRGAVQVETS